MTSGREPDWKDLTDRTTNFEVELVAFLASIKRPVAVDDHDYSAFYGTLEVALQYLGEARAIAQETPFMQGFIGDDGKRIPIGVTTED